MSSAEAIGLEESGFVSIRAQDFDGTRRVALDAVPPTATVGEVVNECVRALHLPFEKFYHALFRGVVAGRVANDGRMPGCAWIPEWSDDPPSVTGLSLSLDGAAPERYGKEVFAPQASALLRAMAEASGDAKPAQDLAWRVVARAAAPRASRFAARTSRASWPLEPARLPDVAPGELDAWIDPALLDAVQEQTLRAGTVERAWLLLGRVLHDAERGAASVRALRALAVEPGAGGASQLHFAFGAATWVAARRALRAVGTLVPVGWAHSHPACEACPANPACEADTVFFSDDDRQVQATAFPSPFMLALVVGKLGGRPATQPGFRLFAWNRGEVRERAFRGARADERSSIREEVTA